MTPSRSSSPRRPPAKPSRRPSTPMIRTGIWSTRPTRMGTPRSTFTTASTGRRRSCHRRWHPWRLHRLIIRPAAIRPPPGRYPASLQPFTRCWSIGRPARATPRLPVTRSTTAKANGSGPTYTAGTFNQQVPLANRIFTGSVSWQGLGVFWITSGTLSLALLNEDGGSLDADEMRVVAVDPTLSASIPTATSPPRPTPWT